METINEHQEYSNDELSPSTYARLAWALTTGGIVLVFFFLSWLSIQRAEILTARRHTREAEEQAAAAQRERDAAWRERADTMRSMNDRIAKAEMAQRAAENDLRAALANTARLGTSEQYSSNANATTVPAHAGKAVPSAQELTAYIREHLSRMTGAGPFDADYADEVDFHGKRYTRSMIENERKAWAQKYPVRATVPQQVQPQITFSQSAVYPWSATAVFDWAWAVKSRTGTVIKGVSRDTWEIAPAADGSLKIIAEHSADPTTGKAKD